MSNPQSEQAKAAQSKKANTTPEGIELPNPYQDWQMGTNAQGDAQASYEPTPEPVEAIERAVEAQQTIELTGAEIVWATLEGEGVREVFGYPGGAIMPDLRRDARSIRIRHVLVRHEQGAAHMADGYARASGKSGRRDRHLGSGRDQSW